MYLGTKLKFRASMIPTSFKDDSFEEFKDYKKVEKESVNNTTRSGII